MERLGTWKFYYLGNINKKMKEIGNFLIHTFFG